MTAITALLLFTAWTLVLMLVYVGPRVALVLAMKKPANSWGRDDPNVDPAFLVRAKHAHLNCLENLPLFAAIVLAAAALGKSPVVDQVAAFVLYARLAQSVTHLIGVSHWLVFIRANFLIIQAALFAWMIWGLLQ
ncbi:MAG: MAPEG family protein [Gammaproteobacteria bacterium]